MCFQQDTAWPITFKVYLLFFQVTAVEHLGVKVSKTATLLAKSGLKLADRILQFYRYCSTNFQREQRHCSAVEVYQSQKTLHAR